VIGHLAASGIVMHNDHVLPIQYRKAGPWLYHGVY
jgi:hypothetical protein